MAAKQDEVLNNLEVKGLANFTAFHNKAIKVVFEDRTIVRMMQSCDIVRVLNKRGDEMLFNLKNPNAAYFEYQNYVQVSLEYFEWVFASPEERLRKEEEDRENK